MGTRIIIHIDQPVDSDTLERMDEAIGVPHSTAIVTDRPVGGVTTERLEFDGHTFTEEDHIALFAVLKGDFTTTSEELAILYRASHAENFSEDLRHLLEQAVGPNTAEEWRARLANAAE